MNREALLSSIERHEGFRDAPYRDSLGLLTIGIGRCLETNPLKPAEYRHLIDRGLLTLVLKHEGATWLVENQVDALIGELSSEFGFWPALPAVAQEVLIEMAFQVGVSRIMGFKKMLAALAKHDYKEAAAAGLDSKWRLQTPKRAEELMTRLEAL